MKRIPIKPVGTKLLIKPDVAEDEIRGSGIIIPEGAKVKPQTGTIVGVGPEVEGGFKEGMKVIFTKFADVVFKWGDEEYAFVDESDILGVVK